MALPNFEQVPFKFHKGTCVFESCEFEEIETMEVRPDDVWVLSFPRSGTTLTQEIVYMLKSNMDFQTAKSIALDRRFPFLDLYLSDMTNFRGLRQIQTMTSPRLIKSHLHRHVLPRKLFDSTCKKIYVMRNPKDVMVSCFMLTKFLRQTQLDTSMDIFLENWLDNKTYATPWWRHVRDFWENRADQSLLILKYEDMVKDLGGAIRSIANHIDVKVNDDDIGAIADHCGFDQMKRNESTNAGWMLQQRNMDPNYGGHIRRGKVGGWRDYLTPEMSRKVDRMVCEKLGDTDLQFCYG